MAVVIRLHHYYEMETRLTDLLINFSCCVPPFPEIIDGKGDAVPQPTPARRSAEHKIKHRRRRVFLLVLLLLFAFGLASRYRGAVDGCWSFFQTQLLIGRRRWC